MFSEDYTSLCHSGLKKLWLYRNNRLGYTMSSMLAGMFISFGSFASMTIGGIATSADSKDVKILVAFVFSAALSLVITAGCELFTGNNLVLAASAKRKDFSILELSSMWLLCYVGNLIGSWILILVFQTTGLTGNESISQFFASTAEIKTHLTALQLLSRGILCNACVCLAVWCSVRLKNEVARLIMVFWCIMIFMLCGFEHCIANMSIIGVALLNSCGHSVTISGYIWNLLFVTLGNIIGGVLFVEFPYRIIASDKK